MYWVILHRKDHNYILNMKCETCRTTSNKTFGTMRNESLNVQYFISK